jgi:glycosyltransferase involved in cell wall biosynthesis
MLYFGLVRAYKGIDELIDVVIAHPNLDVDLRIVGWVVDAELGEKVAARSATDERVSSTLRYISDAELADEVGQATLVVLPYLAMHNSGATLVALSLERPVLVPRNPITTALADEVGRDWVHLYDGPLTADTISASLSAASVPASARPNLAARDWDAIARSHAAVYQQAAAAGRRRPS